MITLRDKKTDCKENRQNMNRIVSKQQFSENVFKFEVTLRDGENKFEAKAGNLTDATMLCRTDEPHPEYKVQKVDTKNWM